MVSKEQKVIKSLCKVLRKKYKEIPSLLNKKHSVLEHLIYAAFLENTSIEKANYSFSVLERYFIDWNEIRVSTANELASVFPLLHDPVRTGERIRRTLQWIFENYFKFDLEELRGQKIEEIHQFLANIPFTTHFMIHYVSHLLLGIPTIPLDEGLLRVMRLLEQVQINDENHEFVPIFNKIDSSYFSLLHEFGSTFMEQTEPGESMNILISIDPDVSLRSWLPLVDDEEADPAEIAKKVARKDRKSKLPAIIPIEDIDIEETIDPDLIVEDVDQFGFESEVSWEDEKQLTVSDDSSTELKKPKPKKSSKTSDKIKKRESRLSIQFSETEIISEYEQTITTKTSETRITKKESIHTKKTRIHPESIKSSSENEQTSSDSVKNAASQDDLSESNLSSQSPNSIKTRKRKDSPQKDSLEKESPKRGRKAKSSSEKTYEINETLTSLEENDLKNVADISSDSYPNPLIQEKADSVSANLPKENQARQGKKTAIKQQSDNNDQNSDLKKDKKKESSKTVKNQLDRFISINSLTTESLPAETQTTESLPADP
ncbi:MAG: hypothetical protein Q4C95_04070, partial [Planctomycetia bacterium]|nr:hypothetical protein [Planctomycetia bacterium]